MLTYSVYTTNQSSLDIRFYHNNWNTHQLVRSGLLWGRKKTKKTKKTKKGGDGGGA